MGLVVSFPAIIALRIDFQALSLAACRGLGVFESLIMPAAIGSGVMLLVELLRDIGALAGPLLRALFWRVFRALLFRARGKSALPGLG